MGPTVAKLKAVEDLEKSAMIKCVLRHHLEEFEKPRLKALDYVKRRLEKTNG